MVWSSWGVTQEISPEVTQNFLLCVPHSEGSHLVCLLKQAMHTLADAATLPVLASALSLTLTDRCCGLANPSLAQAQSYWPGLHYILALTCASMCWLLTLPDLPQIWLSAVAQPDMASPPVLTLTSGYYGLAQLAHTHSGSHK